MTTLTKVSAVALLTLLTAGAARAGGNDKDKHQQAAAALTKLGAWVKVRKKPKGEMETSVRIMDESYVGRWQGKDADLKHLQALSNLTELQVISKRVTDAGMAHIGRAEKDQGAASCCSESHR